VRVLMAYVSFEWFKSSFIWIGRNRKKEKMPKVEKGWNLLLYYPNLLIVKN
jgi:hypothetical protein